MGAPNVDFGGSSPLSFIAGGNITANSMVKLDTTEGQVVACTALTDLPIGVCMDTGTAGLQVRVQVLGKAKVRYGATITVGQELMVKDSGTGELNVASGATAVSCAKALQGGASGETCLVLLLGPVGKGPANS
jgi:hypothetical protein